MTTETSTRGERSAGRQAASADASASPGGLSHRQILTILTGLMMGMFLAALDQTIVSTAIRTIADDLNGLSVQAWVTTAYLITSTIATPLYGKLSDIYGRKPFFIAAISIFVVGSALCSFSTSMYMLAAFRAFQGLGAGGLFSLALAIVGDIVSPRERAKYQGYFLAVFGTSSVLGPVIGGFFAGAGSILWITGWRWVFLVNVPIGIAALYVVNHTLHIAHHKHDHRIDYKGAVSLVVALVPLLTVAEQGRQWGWGSGRSLACFVVGVVGVIAFYLSERSMGDEALIPLRLFSSRTISISTVANIIIGMGMFGGIVVLPLYLQIVKGSSPTVAGLQLLPLTLGIMSASVFSGQLISRTGRYKVFPVVGASLMLVALLAFSRIAADTPLWQTMIVMFVFGAGLGQCMQPLVLAIQNAVSPRDIGVATSSATFFRQIGGTVGVAVFLSILFSTVPGKISAAFTTAQGTAPFRAALADPSNAKDVATLRAATSGGTSTSALNDSSFIEKIDARLAHPFKVGFADSMHLVFLCAAAIVLVGLVVLFFLPQVALRTQSGLQAAAAERSAGEAAGAAAGGGAGAGAGLPAPAAAMADGAPRHALHHASGDARDDGLDEDAVPEYHGKHEA